MPFLLYKRSASADLQIRRRWNTGMWFFPCSNYHSLSCLKHPGFVSWALDKYTSRQINPLVMVNKPPFKKIDNPFIQVPLRVKTPNPGKGRRKITSCHTHLSQPTPFPQNTSFISPLTGFPQNLRLLLTSEKPYRKTHEKISVKTSGTASVTEQKKVLLRDAIWNTAYLLLWNESCVSLGDFSCQHSVAITFYFYKPSEKPISETLQLFKGTKQGNMKLLCQKKLNKI